MVKDQCGIVPRGSKVVESHSHSSIGRKVSRHGMSTYVEKFVYSKRKSCVKRRLTFDESDEEVGKRVKLSKGSQDVDVYDHLSSLLKDLVLFWLVMVCYYRSVVW
jgi:hypothetical protein